MRKRIMLPAFLLLLLVINGCLFYDFRSGGGGGTPPAPTPTGLTYYVSVMSGDDTDGDGSMDNPFRSITHALSLAVSGDTIYVSMAVIPYSTATGEVFPLVIPDGVALRAYPGTFSREEQERPVAMSVTLDAGDNNRILEMEDCGAETVITGIRINNGYAQQTGSRQFNGFGGGISCVNSSPLITGCSFSGNYGDFGGAISLGNSSPTITNCIFAGNSAEQGGAISCYDWSSPIISNCYFLDNQATAGGGAVTSVNSSPEFINCLFADNQSPTGQAGAIYANTYSTLQVSSCTFNNNTAPYGGAIACRTNTLLNLANSILSNNACPPGGLGGGILTDDSTCTITYSNFYQNTPSAAYHNFDGSIANFAGWGWNGTGCLNVDPRYTLIDNYHLYFDSLCINAADPAYSGYLLDGNWETQDGTPDLTPLDMGYHYRYYPAP